MVQKYAKAQNTLVSTDVEFVIYSMRSYTGESLNDAGGQMAPRTVIFDLHVALIILTTGSQYLTILFSVHLRFNVRSCKHVLGRK